MCLTNSKPVNLKKSITAYKIQEQTSGSDKWVAPFRGGVQPMNERLYAIGTTRLDEWVITREIDGGFFHSFKRKKDAIKHAKELVGYNKPRVVEIKIDPLCICFKGKVNDLMPGYASNRMIVTQEVWRSND